MEAVERRRIDPHIEALSKGCVRGRQIVCKASASGDEISARCSVNYCARDICVTLVYSLQRGSGAVAVAWQIDVCPDVSAFVDVSVSPFDLLTVEDLASWNVDDPASSLEVLSLFLQRLSRHMREQVMAIDNSRVNFTLEAMEQRGMCDMLVTQSDVSTICMEGILFPSSEPLDARIEKLADMLRFTPVWLGIRFTLQPFSNPPAEILLQFPEQMSLSSKLVKPIPMSEQETLFDIIPVLEENLAASWANRSIFIETLASIAAVIEYDAVDCSFVSLLVRARAGKRFSLCTVDIRLPYTFPASKPLVTVHGLSDGYAKMIEDNELPYNPCWDPVKAAKTIYCSVCDTVIQSMEA